MHSRVVIRGLVKAQRLVEQRLKEGVLPAQETALTEWIGRLVGEVEEICARYRLSPDALPVPSRRAYTYLKAMAVSGLPADAQKPVPPPDPVLVASFERVNRRYFDRKLGQPILGWSARVTRREFGRYVPETDQLTLSKTLSAPDVPEWVLDFVMYHELLHKHLGFRQSNGRSYSHTPEFRQAERCYPLYEKTQAFLQALAAKKKPARRTR